MGSENSKISRKKLKREEITKKYDSFDYRSSPDEEFTFIQRAKRELTGGYAPDDFMTKIYAGFREFIIETAVEILVSDRKPEKDKYTGAYTAPPLVDEMWILSILYSKKYKELCEYLVGAVIDRAPQQRIKGFKFIKSIWPAYEKSFWPIDRQNIAWIYNKDIKDFLNFFYDKIKESAENDRIEIRTTIIKGEIKKLQGFITDRYTNLSLKPYNTPIPPSHPTFNPSASGSPSEINQKILSLLKYCVTKIPITYSTHLTYVWFRKLGSVT